MSSEDRPVEFVAAQEEAGVSRNLIIWLTKWLDVTQDAPEAIARIDYEFMPAKEVCMALSLIQGTYIVERFIDGSYIAECQFKIIYRLNPSSQNRRLEADELLDEMANWANGQTPFIGDGLEVQDLEQTTASALFAILDSGWEDHQIFMRMTYKANPGK